eukprot:TRINITY_DN5325_c0_g2_i2.p1 TRINITY_DN5325_c0_g2~~TRINITY_DN5325_c0_g2_i2.p1  ORF type:complete len:123 (-),score=19.22 TRINITY_DN5325_c0_g2_i2:180-503(-)
MQQAQVAHSPGRRVQGANALRVTRPALTSSELAEEPTDFTEDVLEVDAPVRRRHRRPGLAQAAMKQRQKGLAKARKVRAARRILDRATKVLLSSPREESFKEADPKL